LQLQVIELEKRLPPIPEANAANKKSPSYVYGISPRKNKKLS
jgi:hypothetical protein